MLVSNILVLITKIDLGVPFVCHVLQHTAQGLGVFEWKTLHLS